MASAPRVGRKGGKVASSPHLINHELTPGGAMSPASLLMHTEGTTIFSDPNAAHPFDPDAITNTKRPASSEVNILQFDMDAIQLIGRGVVVGRAKQVRTRMRKPQVERDTVETKFREAIAMQKNSPVLPSESLWLEKLSWHNLLAMHRPHEALLFATVIASNVLDSCVLVVVPRYFEVSYVKNQLISLSTSISSSDVGTLCGQTFEGAKSTRLWVTSAEMALLYLAKLQTISPFTHVIIPCPLSTTPLLSCFVRVFHEWLKKSSKHSSPARLVVTTGQSNCTHIAKAVGEVKIPFIDDDAMDLSSFSYDEVCALLGKEMMEMERDQKGKLPSPAKRLVDYTARLASELVRHILHSSSTPQVIVIFTAESRDTLTALQEACIDDCAVFSGLKSTSIKSEMKHRVHVMNHVRYALDSDNEYTIVLDMGTIRRSTAQHKSESFMAANNTEWETKTEREERIFSLSAGRNGCYFAFFPDEVCTTVCGDVQPFPDMISVESAFVQCARASIPVNVMTTALSSFSAETAEQVMHEVAEKCMIVNPRNLAVTFVGEIAARLPVEIDIAYFIVGGCNIGLGEAALVIGSVAALPFRTTAPLTYSMDQWSEFTQNSRSKYAGDIAVHSDLAADALVFLEWLRLRARGAPTDAFLEEILVQEFKMEKIAMLMNYMRDQLTNYVFLEHFDHPDQLENVSNCLKDNSSILLLLMSVALARRAAFIRDAGSINPKDRHASMVFVRTSKQLVPHSFIPSGTKWETGGIMISVLLKNSSSILAGLFSLIHTPYFFASLLLLYPQVEYSRPILTDKGRVVYFGVSCNMQMKRFAVLIDEAAQILDFRERMNSAMGCMQALRTLTHPITRTKFALALKEHDRFFDMERLHKEIQRQLQELVTELSVQEHQGSFETFATHCIAPKEIVPATDTQATDVLMLRHFSDGSLWEREQKSTPIFAMSPGNLSDGVDGTFKGILDVDNDDDDDEVEIIQNSYFMRHGPLIEDEED
uniref:Uncharacterized protein n=1 Tax=Trypanosoma vivax (strain Y486) TaxID=1055687 RepID=G0U392_TRYVY|nr:conserved hypothetical protein [Trypanosoma vivax Y486]